LSTTVRPCVFDEVPTVIGHRGLGSGLVAGQRQNTLGSFSAAVRSGARWVEADVRRTGDDTLVVAHDATYPDGTVLTDLSGAETDRRGTLRLRTLLDELPSVVGVNIDLKSSIEDCLRAPAGTTAGLLATEVSDEVGRRPMMVSSFDPGALHLLRQEAPSVPLGLLTWYRFPLEMAVAACAHLDVEVLALQAGSLGAAARGRRADLRTVERLLSLVHGCARQLMIWCPRTELARFLLAAGTDAVVVDDVPTVLGALAGSV
jgi:glycerophosphoryl diester phosphodiesterase